MMSLCPMRDINSVGNIHNRKTLVDKYGLVSNTYIAGENRNWNSLISQQENIMYGIFSNPSLLGKWKRFI